MDGLGDDGRSDSVLHGQGRWSWWGTGNHIDALSVRTDSIENESNAYWKTSGHSKSEKSL